jgi:hypothetical protein
VNPYRAESDTECTVPLHITASMDLWSAAFSFVTVLSTGIADGAPKSMQGHIRRPKPSRALVAELAALLEKWILDPEF